MTSASATRAPAVAGRFYPGEAAALAAELRRLLTGRSAARSAPMAVISPHAGYLYSGALTAQALAAARGARPSSIAVLSPSHRHAFDGIALPSWDVFAMPGFHTVVDTTACAHLVERDLAHVEDAAHDREHGVEVQLPFLAALFPGVPVVPLVIGRAEPGAVAACVDALAAQAPQTLFVLSSDLSHFLSFDNAQARDAETARRIETGDTDLAPEDACGARAIAGFFRAQVAQGARVQRLAMENSMTASGDGARTVGYGAWAIFPGQSDCLPDPLRKQLLGVARQTLASRFKRGKPPAVNVASFVPPLQTYCASFVTLEQEGRLRGCIGSLRAHKPLVEDVSTNALKAAFEDPRFRPLRPEELAGTTLKLALLSPPGRMGFADQADLEAQLVPHRDGLILRDGRHAGTFLPMVWEKLDTPRAFLEALKLKAGLPKDHWSETLTIDRYHAESFAELA